MDWVTVAIGLGVCVITAMVLYLISVYSFKEHTFEEALAQQQKFSNSLLKGDKANIKEKEKKPKKTTKKTKDKEKKDAEPTVVAPTAAVVAPTAAVEEKPHVEFEPDEEIISAEPAPAHSESEKKKTEKKEKVKPILKNTDSSTANELFDPDVDTINHFSEVLPKDDMEMKGKDNKEGKNAKNKGLKAVEEKVVVEVPVVEPIATKEMAFLVGRNAASQSQQHGTPKKQQRKKMPKSDALDNIDGGEELLLLLGGTEKLLSALRRLPLSVAELQTLIEVLLNRQQEASETFESDWMERSGRLDPIAALRKQLADKDKTLLEEIEEKQSYQNKLRSLGTEIAAERTRAGQARNQLEEALNRQTGEITGMNLRIQQLVEHHANELAVAKNNFIQAQKASLSDEHLRQIQRLQEEKGQMEARFAAVQQDVGSRVQQLEDLLRHKDQHLDELMRHKEQQMEQEVQLQNQFTLVKVQLQESEQVRSAMLLESEQSLQAQQGVAQLREALAHQEAQFHQAAMESHGRLEELERTKQLLEDRITTIDRELLVVRNIASQKESELQQGLERMTQEKQQLLEQLAEAKAQQNDQPFDDVTIEAMMMKNEDALQSQRAIAAEKESQLNSEIERLQSDNKTLAEQLSASQAEQTEQAKTLTVNNEATLEAERATASEKESQLNSAIERLQGENKMLAEQLSSQIEQAKQSDVQTVLEQERVIAAQKESDFQTELQRLRDENQELAQKLSSLPEIQENHEAARLETVLKEKDAEFEAMKTKNNELREKNYKAMDALAEAEKALVLSKQSANTSSEVQQSIGARLLQVFPELTFDTADSPSSFADNIANQVALSLTRLQEDEQSKAQAQILRYKTVLSQTEELLNLLQSRVEAEEQSSKAKLARLEQDLASTKQEGQFWMEQCKKQAPEQTTEQNLEQSEQQSAEVASLQSQLDALLKDKEEIAQEMEKLRLEKTSELEDSQRRLVAAEEMAANEKEAAQLLREQLDTTKVFIVVVGINLRNVNLRFSNGTNGGTKSIRQRWQLPR